MSALFMLHAHLPSLECVRSSKAGRRNVLMTQESENIPRQIQTLFTPHTIAGSGVSSHRASPRKVCFVERKASSIPGKSSSISGRCSLWGMAKASVKHALVLATRSVIRHTETAYIMPAMAYLRTYRKRQTPPTKRLEGNSISWCLLFVFAGFYEILLLSRASTC
jgi:hypothetical protein